MKLLNVPLGLLINFHEMKLTDGVHRLIAPRSEQMKNKTQQEPTERTQMKEIFLLTLLPPVRTQRRTVSLLAEMFQGLAHRRAGNSYQSADRAGTARDLQWKLNLPRYNQTKSCSRKAVIWDQSPICP